MNHQIRIFKYKSKSTYAPPFNFHYQKSIEIGLFNQKSLGNIYLKKNTIELLFWKLVFWRSENIYRVILDGI